MGWANQNSIIPGIEEITSDEFPEDYAQRIQNVHLALTQLNGTGLMTMPGLGMIPGMSSAYPVGLMSSAMGLAPMVQPTVATSQVANVAEEAINAALGLPSALAPVVQSEVADAGVKSSFLTDPKQVGGADFPTSTILVHNMFDKDTETEEGWEEEIRLDFEEECGKYGKLRSVVVMSQEPGGKIYSSFEAVEDAKSCAENLAGRWFDKRLLRVEFVADDSVPKM